MPVQVQLLLVLPAAMQAATAAEAAAKAVWLGEARFEPGQCVCVCVRVRSLTPHWVRVFLRACAALAFTICVCVCVCYALVRVQFAVVG